MAILDDDVLDDSPLVERFAIPYINAICSSHISEFEDLLKANKIKTNYWVRVFDANLTIAACMSSLRDSTWITDEVVISFSLLALEKVKGPFFAIFNSFFLPKLKNKERWAKKVRWKYDANMKRIKENLFEAKYGIILINENKAH